MTRRIRWAAGVALAGSCVLAACGGGFTEDLTVDTDAIASDPIFDLSPPGATVVSDTELTGTTTSFRLRKTWGSVTRDAFLDTLGSTTDQETVLSWADCLDSLDEDDVRDITIGGFKQAGGYRVVVDYRYAGGQLGLSVGGPNDLEQFDDAAALPASPTELESQTCTEDELRELSRFAM